MNEVRKLINVCKASGFKSAYTLLVLATLIIYASIEALFAGKISTFEFGVQPKGNNYNFLAILFILKILFQLLSTFLLVKFGFHSGEKLQEFILEQINQKRKLLSSDQSKVLIKRYLLNEPLNIANLIMIPLMLFICEALVTIFLGIIVLMNISNELLFILLQVLISIFIFAYFSKSLTHKWGEKRKVFESRRIESINTYTDNFAFFALNKFQNKMVKRILEDSHSQFSYNSNQAFIDKVPRIFLELLIFTVVVLSFVSTGENNENINIVIGEFILLGYVGFRLFPASNRLLMSLQSINFALQGFEDTLL